MPPHNVLFNCRRTLIYCKTVLLKLFFFFRFSIFVFRASGDGDDMAGLLVPVQQISGVYITRLQIVKHERNVCFRKDGFFITDFTYWSGSWQQGNWEHQHRKSFQPSCWIELHLNFFMGNNGVLQHKGVTCVWFNFNTIGHLGKNYF